MLTAGSPVRCSPRFPSDPNVPLAGLEAKDRTHVVGACRQQALTFAVNLDVTFVYTALAEQRRIVAKVAQQMALMDALETRLIASRAATDNRLSSLVAELTAAPNPAWLGPDKR